MGAGGTGPKLQRRLRALGVVVAMTVVASACSRADNSGSVDLFGGSSTTTTLPTEFFDHSDTEGADDSDDSSTPLVPARTQTTKSEIFVDQFGYRPADAKVAVIADPTAGYNATDEFSPGDVIEVRNAETDEVVFWGEPVAWNDGEIHAQSGDRGWWFDFSKFDDPGTYYVVDVESDSRTGDFVIDEDVYADVLHTALKVFWFNRGNTPHPEELGGPWSDGAAYAGPGQDPEARSADDREDETTARDLSGGWFDAGDTNKYVSFAAEPVHVLLTAYQKNPDVFDDNVGIPESSNGIPDIIDELKWELDWLERMQVDGGGVLTKVGDPEWGYNPVPSLNQSSRFYVEPCSSSTISAAAMFAHAAIVFAEYPELREYSERLEQRAESAWDWYQIATKRDDCDSGEIKAGDADMSIERQAQTEVVAAVYLYALTNRQRYDDVVRAGYSLTTPFEHDSFHAYYPHQGDALLYYRDLPSAHHDTAHKIDERLVELTSSLMYGVNSTDLYRSHLDDSMYHWGSNRVKASVGYSNFSVLGHRGDTTRSVRGGDDRALAHLNYFHGVNPLGLVYLSNMGALGADHSVQRMHHYWFGRTSIFDVDVGSTVGVAPGYLVGGPNKDYTGKAAPPAGEPPQKSYRDWNDSKEPVWQITEPAIYYQASYVRLLSEIIASN